MKKTILLLTLTLLHLSSCGDSSEIDLGEATSQVEESIKPINPVVKTDYGQIADYHTMDDYYLDENGKKIWHGYRKNLYPTLSPKTVSYYEYGEEIWTETYDEVGNVLTSNK